MAEVVLSAGRARVVVEGGELLGLRSWVVGGVEVLAAPSALPAPYRVHGRRAGVTLLHPWANRVGADAFAVAGRTVQIPRDATVSRDAGGLAIHGLAAPGAWVPEAVGAAGCAVRRRVAASPAFPFAHDVAVDVLLGEDGHVAVTTTVEARDGPVPIAFGWHPYVAPVGPREDRTLELPARGHLPLDAAGLPSGAAIDEPTTRAPLGERTFDDAYVGVAGTRWATGAFELELGPGYDVAQVFAPGDVDVVSLEPMTAPPDALRSGAGLRCLAPGGRWVATFALRLRP